MWFGDVVKAAILQAGLEQNVSVWFIGMAVILLRWTDDSVYDSVYAQMPFYTNGFTWSPWDYFKCFHNYMVIIEGLNKSSLWLLCAFFLAEADMKFSGLTIEGNKYISIRKPEFRLDYRSGWKESSD